MALQPSRPSAHNAMLGRRIAHPKSTNFDEDDGHTAKRPTKRLKTEHSEDETDSIALPSPRIRAREILDSEADSDDEDLSPPAPTVRTDLETALGPVRTDKEAIEEYEAFREAEDEHLQEREGRLKDRKWVKGKSSIYVDAFNLALDTVLEDESHLFDEAEKALFDHWRNLSYEAQYLYVFHGDLNFIERIIKLTVWLDT